MSYAIIFSLMIVYQMPNVFSGSVYIFAISLIGSFCLIKNIRSNYNNIFAPALLLALTMIVHTLIGDLSHIDNVFNTLIKIVLWFMVFNIGCNFNRNNINNKVLLVLIIAYVLISLIIEQGNFASDYSNPNKFYEITTMYYLLLALPFVLCINNKKIKLLLSCSIGIVCVFSFKRNILITLILIVVAWIASQPRLSKKIKYLSIALSILLIAGLFLLSYSDSYRYILDIWSVRFGSSSSLLGSRGDIYSNVLELMKKSNIFEWIFGHGHNTVAYASSTGFSAHNDFLEILYDYGIISLFIYLWIIRNLLCLYLYQRRYGTDINDAGLTNEPLFPNSFALLVSIIIISVSGMFSHLITYPTHFMLIALFWGWYLQ